MKKILALLLALAALSALAVTAFATSEPAADPAAAPEAAAEIAAALSPEAALAAALKDAGEAEANVTVTKNKLSEKTTEAGETIPVYTVKFTTATTEYKYYIEGNTGAVIYKSVEFQNPDIVLKSRGQGRSDSASGEMDGSADTENTAETADSGRSGRASGEMAASGETASGGTRGSGRHKTADAVTGASQEQPDAAGI